MKARARPASVPPDALDLRPPLVAGVQALGVSLEAGQVEQLLAFSALLRRWNEVHNLTAIRRTDELLTHHLLDSLAVVPPVAALGPPAALLDVGSGGGLPGIPLAIALPATSVTLLDAVQKKCAFLTQVALELGLRNVLVVHQRVEDHCGQYPAIISRAFASLADFVRLTRHLLAPGGCWLAMKARPDAAEWTALPADVRIARRQPLTVPGLAEERHLLELRAA